MVILRMYVHVTTFGPMRGNEMLANSGEEVSFLLQEKFKERLLLLFVGTKSVALELLVAIF